MKKPSISENIIKQKMIKSNYFSPDILDFLKTLTKHNVKFVIVGGEAVIYYGHARLTGDIDIYYENSVDNVEHLWNSLLEFWDNDIPLLKEKNELLMDGLIVQFGVPPNRIDLINKIEGVNFSEVWAGKKEVTITLPENKNIRVYFIGIKELIKNKKATGRNKDLDDVKFLQKVFSKISDNTK